MDASEHFVYVANWGSHDVSAFSLDKTTGAISEIKGSPFGTDWYPYAVVVDKKTNFAYVANNGAGNIGAYAIDKNSGALSPLQGSPFHSDLGPYGLAISN